MTTIHVLLVDDDEDDYLITRDLLLEIEGGRYDLRWADGYERAVELLATGEFDVCLLDYRLGPRTGLELLEESRAAGIHVPFILMTGQEDREIDLMAMEAGAADYLIKGQINAALLERSIRYSVQRNGMIRELRASEERLSDALRRSESRFRRLADSNMIGIIVADVHGEITEANDAFLGMIGYGRADFEAGSFRWNGMTPQEYAEADARAIEEILALGACRPFEKEYFRSDGSRVPVLLGGALVEGSRDTLIAFVLDLGDLKRIERRLQEASRAKDRFLAVLSHELRTPLTPVLSLVQVMAEDPELPEMAREYVDIIRRNVELEARLIDDLLDLTRVMQGKFPLHLTHVDVEQLIYQVVAICREDIDARDITLTIDWSATRGGVRGDSARLHQVFWNLLKNAAKFTPPAGSIAIRARNDAAGRLLVQVTDSGIGIEPEILPKIFNAFEQGDKGVTQRFGGLGLGLAITRSVVALHDGQITAESQGRDRGSTFTVVLPTEGSGEEHVTGDCGAADGEPEERALDPAACRILLVEDHADSREMIARLLRGRGYEVHTATTIVAALETAALHEPDLIISDIGLPDGSGTDLIEALRGRGPVRAIAISGFGMDENIRQSLAAGFAEHLTKPVTLQRLIEAIRRLCREHEVR
jgi:PAS domain S-box-containing protein